MFESVMYMKTYPKLHLPIAELIPTSILDLWSTEVEVTKVADRPFERTVCDRKGVYAGKLCFYDELR